MAHVSLPAHLFKSLHLTRPENYNVYLVGSRLWGTHTDTSDWDLLMVGDIPREHLTSHHKSQYDVKLLDQQEFVARVKQGSIIEVVCALLRKEDMVQWAFNIGDLSIDPEAMKSWLDERLDKDFQKAEKFWLKGNRQSGWKILRHMMHSKVLYNHLIVTLRDRTATISINDVQNIIRPVTVLCERAWMQLDWSDVHAAVTDILKRL